MAGFTLCQGFTATFPLICWRTTVSFPPIAGWNPLPCAEGTTKRVQILKTKQVSSLVQLQHGVGEIIAGHPVAGFIKDPLIVIACVLQAALYCARAHVKRLGNNVDRRTMPGQPVLNRAADKFDKSVFRLELPQLFFKLWRKQIEQFRIAGNEWRCSIRSAEDDGIARSTVHQLATEVPLERAKLCRFQEPPNCIVLRKTLAQ